MFNFFFCFFFPQAGDEAFSFCFYGFSLRAIYMSEWLRCRFTESGNSDCPSLSSELQGKPVPHKL